MEKLLDDIFDPLLNMSYWPTIIRRTAIILFPLLLLYYAILILAMLVLFIVVGSAKFICVDVIYGIYVALKEQW